LRTVKPRGSCGATFFAYPCNTSNTNDCSKPVLAWLASANPSGVQAKNVIPAFKFADIPQNMAFVRFLATLHILV